MKIKTKKTKKNEKAISEMKKQYKIYLAALKKQDLNAAIKACSKIISISGKHNISFSVSI